MASSFNWVEMSGGFHLHEESTGQRRQALRRNILGISRERRIPISSERASQRSPALHSPLDHVRDCRRSCLSRTLVWFLAIGNTCNYDRAKSNRGRTLPHDGVAGSDQGFRVVGDCGGEIGDLFGRVLVGQAVQALYLCCEYLPSCGCEWRW